MAKRSFRDRFFTAPVARAIMSPLGILLFGAVGAGTIVAGLPIPGALGIGAAVWAANVLRSIPKDKKPDRVDPFTLSEPWRSYVSSAQGSKARFDRTVADTSAGPIRDRLEAMGSRLDDGVADCWKIANRADDIQAAINNLNTPGARLQLNDARRHAQDYGMTPSLEQTIQSLEAQVATGQRMEQVVGDAQGKLRLLNARLDELVARATEVSVGAADSGSLSDEIDDVVGELEALRQAIDVTDSIDDTASGRTPRPIDTRSDRERSTLQPPAPPAPSPQTFPPSEPQSETWPPSS